MKKLKTVLSIAALALLTNTTMAGTLSVPLVITGEVVGVMSMSTSPVALGKHSTDEFNNGPKFQATFTVKVGSGLAYNFCPDTPNTAWAFSGGLATDLTANGSVLMKTYKDDGVTQISPTSCWQRTGTGDFETIVMLIGVNVVDEANAIGLLGKTLNATIYN